MSLPTPPRTRSRIVRLSSSGKSDHAIAAATGVSRETVRRIRQSAGLAAIDRRASAPFGPASFGEPAPKIPPAAYSTDQPVPAPDQVRLIAGYHDATLRTGGYNQHIGGWSVERMRDAIEIADSDGAFLEAWTLAVACTRFAPIFAALRQRVAPELGLQRRVLSGGRGPARIAREEIERQLAPRDGEHPSGEFPANLWGAIAISLAMMGFAILQHVYGPPQGPNGWRPCYSRLWPAWAVYFQRWRRTFVAITREAGNVDIIDGDGKWSIVATSDEPFYQGAVRALGPEYLAGGFAEQAQSAYLDAYGNPHPAATMPPDVGPETPEGRLFFAAAQKFREPGGVILMPNGAGLDMIEMKAGTSSVFNDALSRTVMFIFFALLGNDGSGAKGTGGVYPSPHLFDAKEEIVRDDTRAIVRGVNVGRVRPWTDINIGEVSVYPAVDIPLPDPEQDARATATADRYLKLHEILKSEVDNDCQITQERVDQLAADLAIVAPQLVSEQKSAQLYEWHVQLKLAAADEVRKSLNLPPLPDGAGSVGRLALERLAGKDQAGRKASQGDATLDAAPPTVPEDALPDDPPPPVLMPPPGAATAPPSPAGGTVDGPPAEGGESETKP